MATRELTRWDVSERSLVEGARIRTWRHAHRLSQQALADHLGVVWLTVQRWEAGTRSPPQYLWLALDRLDQLLARGGGTGGLAPVLAHDDANPF